MRFQYMNKVAFLGSKVYICAAFAGFMFSSKCTLAQESTRQHIGQRTLTFKDEKRNRPLITELWYPTTDTLRTSDRKFSPFLRTHTVRNGSLPTRRLPLIMLSHGTGGNRNSLEWLAQNLVEQGYIVAAVDHWGNTNDNKIAIEFLKPWERPQDISFVLNKLLVDEQISVSIDTLRIGAAGFSFGGYTVIALAGGELDYPHMLNYYRTIGHREVDSPEFPGLGKLLYDSTLVAGTKNVPYLKDPRICAFFAICPSNGPGFINKNQFKAVSKPVFIIGVQSDSLAAVEKNAKVYHRLINHSKYYEFKGKAGHYVMLPEAIDELKKESPIAFSDDFSVNRHQIHLKVDEIANRFFQKVFAKLPIRN
jgi:predicted dienelactone hydrolase